MGGKGSGAPLPLVVGEQLGQLTLVAELEPDPHYGRRARYRCACGELVNRICADVRLARRRALARAKSRGGEAYGPSCVMCVRAGWAAA